MNKIIRKHHLSFAAALMALAFVLMAPTLLTRVVGAVGPSDGPRERILTVYDGTEQKGYYTTEENLSEALKKAGVRMEPQDRTEPELSSKLTESSYQVNIYRARPVVVRDGTHETKILSAYRTGAQIADHAGIKVYPEDEAELSPSDDFVGDGAAEILTIRRAVTFTLDTYGTVAPARTMESTVGGMLKEKGITLAKDDVVEPAESTPLTKDMTVRVYRNGIQELTQEEDVDFQTEQTKDNTKDIGFKEVKTPGVKGRRTVTYEINMQNGKEVSRKELKSTMLKEPVKQVEVIGTKANLPSGSHEDWMAAAGIAPSDYGYVNFIVMREGGWEPCKVQGGAINCAYTGSMGYGMVQATPGGKMVSAGSDWRTNPITQLRWATGYAVGRYGSWEAAYSYWTKNKHW